MSTDTEKQLHTIDTGALWRAEWIDERDKLIAIAVNLPAVETQQMLDLAGDMISRCAKHRKQLNQARLIITRQIDALKKQIMDQEKELARDLNDEEQRLRSISSVYLTEEDHRRRRAEAEAEQLRRQAAQDAIEKENAAYAAFGSAAEIQQQPEVLPAPATVKTRPATAGTTTRWDFEILDLNRLPRCYLVPESKSIKSAIRAMVDQGLTPQIDGLRIYSQIDIRARG